MTQQHIAGDVVGADKAEGDKVLGDKHETRQSTVVTIYDVHDQLAAMNHKLDLLSERLEHVERQSLEQHAQTRSAMQSAINTLSSWIGQLQDSLRELIRRVDGLVLALVQRPER